MNVMAYELSDFAIRNMRKTEEGRKYLEYYEIFKSEPFGYGVGAPNVDEMFGSVIGLYEEAIKQGKRWEELLPYDTWDEMQP
jgi:hypothetical protein